MNDPYCYEDKAIYGTEKELSQLSYGSPSSM